MFTSDNLIFNQKTSQARYAEIITFMKNHELLIKNSEKVYPEYPGKIALFQLNKFPVIKMAIIKERLFSVVRQRQKTVGEEIPTKQLTFLLKADQYLYDNDREPLSLQEQDIAVISMIYA